MSNRYAMLAALCVVLPVGTAPLALADPPAEPAVQPAGNIDLATFVRHVHGVAALLPEGKHAINLSEDRYRFLVGFCAVALRGQVTLLPPSRMRRSKSAAVAKTAATLVPRATRQAPVRVARSTTASGSKRAL